MLVKHSAVPNDELDGGGSRILFSISLERLGDYPADLKRPSAHFVVFLALDATSVADGDILAFASRALAQGAVWFFALGAPIAKESMT